MNHKQLDQLLLSMETIYGQSLMTARKAVALLMDHTTKANVLIKAQGTDYVAITIEVEGWVDTYTLRA